MDDLSEADEKAALRNLLGNFKCTAPNPEGSIKSGGTVTIWFSPRRKAQYDRLQEKSGRRFSKKLREIIMTLMDIAEKEAA